MFLYNNGWCESTWTVTVCENFSMKGVHEAESDNLLHFIHLLNILLFICSHQICSLVCWIFEFAHNVLEKSELVGINLSPLTMYFTFWIISLQILVVAAASIVNNDVEIGEDATTDIYSIAFLNNSCWEHICSSFWDVLNVIFLGLVRSFCDLWMSLMMDYNFVSNHLNII